MMSTRNDVRMQLEALVKSAHEFACSLDIGDERTEAFELYEALRRLQRRGAANEMLAATNPLMTDCQENDDEDWWDDEGD